MTLIISGITNWSRRVVMKMFKGTDDTFVCIDDITDTIESMNYVIYNPLKDPIYERVNRLYEKIKERFDIELSSDELNKLTSYESHELHLFVSELKEIIQNKRK